MNYQLIRVFYGVVQLRNAAVREEISAVLKWAKFAVVAVYTKAKAEEGTLLMLCGIKAYRTFVEAHDLSSDKGAYGEVSINR